ncbi:MAG: phasin family protein, partial [Pseudomonadota bacterium]
KLGRELFEVNSSTMRRLFETQAEGVRQYFETNQAFAKRLPEVRDVSSFVELQRDYGQTLWADAQSNLRTNGAILREAVEHTGSALKEAWSGTVEAAKDAVEDVADSVKAA